MRPDNRPFERSLYEKMNCVHRLDLFIPKLKWYTLHISCFHNTKVQMFLLAVFITRSKPAYGRQGLGWDHWAGPFWVFFNFSLRACGAQFGLDRPCKSNWPSWLKNVTSQTGGSNWPFRYSDIKVEMFIFIISSMINFYNYLLCDFRKKIFNCTNTNMLPYRYAVQYSMLLKTCKSGIFL